MGSSSVSQAIDTRQAVTDTAFGYSTYGGNGNLNSLGGNIFNFSGARVNNSIGGVSAAGASVANGGASSATMPGGAAGSTFGTRSAVGGTASGINVNVLDNGAIANSFSFADNSLSKMLSSIIDGQKINQATAQYTSDTIGSALTQSAQVNAAAAAASDAAAAASQQGLLGWIQDNAKKLLIGGGLLAAGYYVMKGRH